MKKCTEYKIGKTTIKKESDYDADLSYLGEYGSKVKPGCIIRADETFIEDHADDEDYEIPGMGNREYSFFYPFCGGEEPSAPDYQKYALQDYKQMEDYNNGQWSMIGITVSTTITTDTGLTDKIVNSLWGIEDRWDKDSREYIQGEIENLKGENKVELLKMGFSESEIDQSLNNANEVD